jgi:hypothetical protein
MSIWNGNALTKKDDMLDHGGCGSTGKYDDVLCKCIVRLADSRGCMSISVRGTMKG